MVEPTDVATYEFLSKDGNVSDEFVPGTTAFRVREYGTRHTAGFLRLVLPSVQIAGEHADTRRGKAVAHLSAAAGPKKPLPLRELAGFRATMPRLRRPAAELLREVRDAGL